MASYTRKACQWPQDPKHWLANFLVPKNRPAGTFQLFIMGLPDVECDFIPADFMLDPAPQMKGVAFRFSVLPYQMEFLESTLHTSWQSIPDLLTEKKFKLLKKRDDGTVEEIKYDPAEWTPYFLGEGHMLSMRWEFTIPQGTRGGGEVHLRGIHMSPDQANSKKLGDDEHNVLSVPLMEPIPVYTVGASPDINLGFTPPFLPTICSDAPMTFIEYKKAADYALFNILQKFIRFDLRDVAYVVENNENGHGIKNHLRFPEPLKQYSLLGTFTAAGMSFLISISITC